VYTSERASLHEQTRAEELKLGELYSTVLRKRSPGISKRRWHDMDITEIDYEGVKM